MPKDNREYINEFSMAYEKCLIDIIISQKSAFTEYSNGVIIQKIVNDVDKKNNELEIIFPIAFQNHLLQITNLGIWNAEYYVKEMSKTRIKLDIRNFNDQFVELLVVGY